MINKGGVILLGLGAAAAFILWPKSAHASPGASSQSNQPSASDRTGAQESQYLQGLIETAIASNNPATMHATANKIRSYNWTHPEVRKAALQEAANLDDYANSLEDYQKNANAQAPAGGHVSNVQEANYPDDSGSSSYDPFGDLTNALGG